MAPARSEIFTGLAQTLNEIIGTPLHAVTPESDLIDDIKADSLLMVEIGIAVQDRFDVEIPDDHLAALRTVGDVVDYIHDNQPAGVAS